MILKIDIYLSNIDEDFMQQTFLKWLEKTNRIKIFVIFVIAKVIVIGLRKMFLKVIFVIMLSIVVIKMINDSWAWWYTPESYQLC